MTYGHLASQCSGICRGWQLAPMRAATAVSGPPYTDRSPDLSEIKGVALRVVLQMVRNQVFTPTNFTEFPVYPCPLFSPLL